MRLTAVQRDVIERLKDGWVLYEYPYQAALQKSGEATRHVRLSTLLSLERRGLIENPDKPWKWVLVE